MSWDRIPDGATLQVALSFHCRKEGSRKASLLLRSRSPTTQSLQEKPKDTVKGERSTKSEQTNDPKGKVEAAEVHGESDGEWGLLRRRLLSVPAPLSLPQRVRAKGVFPERSRVLRVKGLLC